MKLLLLLCALPGGAPFAAPGAPRPFATARRGRPRDDDGAAPPPPPPPPSSSSSSSYGSDLKALLPTPKRRALALDTHGRRVHDLTDDGTARYNLERRGDGPARGAKARAAAASSADFGRAVTLSSDLKGLLPTRKMRFVKLDKFGRRIQRMEDDGTVNTQKEPQPGRTSEDEAGEAAVAESEASSGEASSGEAPAATHAYGALKDLLPRRRASLTRSEAPPPAGAPPAPPPAPAIKYGSLKDLAPTKRATWTRLDFKGGSVEDERRTRAKTATAPAPEPGASGHLTGQGLRDLLPRRTIWTRLDFHGASVEDERRTKGPAPSPEHSTGGSASGHAAGGGGSNLRKFLPERTIPWRNAARRGGAAGHVSGSAGGAREGRQRDMRDAVTAAAAAATAAALSEMEGGGEEPAAPAYTNLRTLLPARTISWRKTQVLSSGSAPTVGGNVRGLREERERDGGRAVTASAAAAALSEMEGEEDAAAALAAEEESGAH